MTLTPPAEPSVLIAELRHPGQERIFVAAVPDADGLALEVGRLLDAGVGAAGQLEPGPLEGLRDVDQRHALFARRQRRRHPVDDDIGAAAGDHLRRGDIGAARLDRDVEAGVLVEALFLGDEVAGELGLRDPFQLDGDGVRRLRGRQRQADRQACGECQNLFHAITPNHENLPT